MVGGSRGLTGAPAMASLAAHARRRRLCHCLRARVASQILDVQLMEVMTRGLPDEQGALTADGLAAALESLERAGALALGPGLGRDRDSAFGLRASWHARRRSRWCSTPTD